MRAPAPQQLAVWILLASPGAVVVGRYATGASGYGEALQVSGDWSVRWLIVALAATPLRLAFPRAGWPMWLLRRRRDIGVATFAYALLHLAVYLGKKAQAPMLIVREAIDPGMAVGWIAFVVLAALAITSNDASVRWLRAGWKTLHRLVYPAAVLALAHWLLTAFDLRHGLVHVAILAAIEAARIVLQRRRPGSGAGSRAG